MNVETITFALETTVAPTGKRIPVREKALFNVLGWHASASWQTRSPVSSLRDHSGLSQAEFDSAVSWLTRNGLIEDAWTAGGRLQAQLIRAGGTRRAHSDANVEQARKRAYAATRKARLKAARRIATHTEAEWRRMVDFCGACVRCRDRSVPVGIDHIVSLACGGSDGIDNLQPLCSDCNTRKGTKDWGDLRPKGWLDAVKKGVMA